ncbi:c5bd23e4-9ba9-4f65-bbce-c118357da4df [Sclerotinia trifoliorum]|uniref:C5bd23e4-9ba9-4f65-bbce-c118357da4df n=1 Tax=Sclerotinia trifoliorum TaxID=28548 RepID=A0A8H2VQ87_9HELO|nr:c5bd23e4-9ba9-4f65-bbce-c118357da4df [Sclerotinia trifoliorum]
MATHDLLTNPLAVRNPNPLNLIPYSVATGIYSPEGKDVYITHANIRPSTHVPGIPSPYSQEQLERRALYISGIPPEWQTPAFRRIFQIYGTVEKCPIIFDLASQSTFRFVVMQTREECLRARDSVHGFVLERHMIFTAEALPSSSLLSLYSLGLDTLGLSTSDAQIDNREDRKDEDEGEIELGDLDINQQNVGINGPYIYGSGILDQTPITHRHPSPPQIKLPTVSVQGAETENESQPPTRKHRPTPLNLTARVVLILNIPHTLTLSDISNAVREGPVVCIRFGIDSDTSLRFSGIVFQHAQDAQTFYDILRGEHSDRTASRFRFLANAVKGDPFPINEDIIAMGAPMYASRRLTIVKKAFFFAFTGKNLQTLCEREVGRENVQLVFVYNGGNATVVFAEVRAAIRMKDRLERLREGAGNGSTCSIYEGLQVSFSKDPCELEGGLNLQAADGYHA